MGGQSFKRCYITKMSNIKSNPPVLAGGEGSDFIALIQSFTGFRSKQTGVKYDYQEGYFSYHPSLFHHISFL